MKTIYLLLILTMATLGCIDEPIEVHITEQVPTQKVIVKISNFSLDGRFLCGNISDRVKHNFSEIILSRDFRIQSYVEHGVISKVITISHPKIELNYWHLYDLQDLLEGDDSCRVYEAPRFTYHISVSIDGTELYYNENEISYKFSHDYLFTRCFSSAKYQEASESCLQYWVDEQFTPDFWKETYKDV